MSQEQNPNNVPAETTVNPFSIFNTKVEDIVVKEEPTYEKIDWDEIFYEPDPKDGKEGVYQALIKFVPNFFNPSKPIARKYSYKLPVPGKPQFSFTFDSPSIVGADCPCVKSYFEHKDSTDPRIKKIVETYLKRNRRSAALIQIVNDPNKPELNGQLRILRFGTDQDIDKLLVSKLAPSEEDMKMGKKAENIFDVFNSRYMILKVKLKTFGEKEGRDFSESSWTDADVKGGMILPSTKKPMTAADADNKEYQEEIVKFLTADPKYNLEEQFAYKEPDEAMFKKVNDALNFLFSGNMPAPTTTNVNTNQPVQQTTVTPTPVQQPTTNVTPATTVNVTPTPDASTQTNDDFLKGLGIVS